MIYRRLLRLAVLAAATVPASLWAGTLLDIAYGAHDGGSGNYTGNGAHAFYGDIFTANAAFSNVSATAMLEGNYQSPLTFATYLYDTSTSTQVISGTVSFNGAFPVETYDLFNGNTFSLSVGDTYAVLIGGSGDNAIWDGSNTPATTSDAAITFNGSVYASSAAASGYTTRGGSLILNLSNSPTSAPEPASAVLFLIPAAALAVRRRVRRS